MQDVTHSHDVFFDNLFKDGEPDKVIVGILPQRIIPDSQSQITEDKVIIFGLDILNDGVKVLLGIQFRRNHVKTELGVSNITF